MKIKITIDGKEYPCAQTMGAMLRFKEETGREATAIQADALSDLAVYLWCCVVSACKREGRDFKLTLMEFADRVTLDDLNAWAAAITSEQETTGKSSSNPEDEEKKTEA